MVKKALRLISKLTISILLLFVVPFNNIYASVQSSIAPTFSSSTTQWNGHLHITNFSDGTNNQASSTLAFTFDDDYYGIVYFDGYGPSNQLIANYASVYVAGGYGEYRYSYYQNAVINITNVTINIVNVVKPQTTVDLTQIITLLTAIENDTSSIDNVLDTTLAQIRLVLAELIESNGYLETLTKIKQWNFPDESLYPNLFMFYQGYEISDMFTYNYWKYPMFKIPGNGLIARPYLSVNEYFYMITIGYSFNNLNAVSVLLDTELTPVSVRTLQVINMPNTDLRINLVQFQNQTSNGYKTINNKYQNNVIFLYYGMSDINGILNVSTDFALEYGLNNRLLNDINLIANGTNASSAASSQSDQANSQLQQDSNTLFTQEDSFKQDMNSAMQNIDTTFTLNNFGSSFMSSAQWVRTQYETLTNNTPFASLITFSLLVGLALIVVGKVYK